MKPMKIFLAGEGGQGIQTIAKILVDAVKSQGSNVSYIPAFGVEQRGTPSTAFITISNDEIRYPRFEHADVVVVLQKRALSVIEKHISPQTKVVFDSSTIPASSIHHHHKLGIPATEVAAAQFKAQSFNILITGKISRLINLDEKLVWDSIVKILGKKFKDDKIRKMNEDCFKYGRNAVFEIDQFSKPTFMPATEKIIRKGFGKSALIIPERCKGCHICIAKCPVAALSKGETLGVFATQVPEIDLEKCIACGNCFRFCPDAAISVTKDKSAK
ncbi:MAG: 2-oxoacid:acceptor oxidoreductase family protein [Patescibacteria group bacterium]|jgi:2-oxoglutarate ferredoxin oxidoreductase subunit gamma